MPTTAPTLCLVRNELAAKVARAIRDVYDAKADLQRVRALKQDTAKFVLHLTEARKAERIAVAALDKHRKEHGC